MYTAYGIVTLCEWSWWLCGKQVERELTVLSQPVYTAALSDLSAYTGHSNFQVYFLL